MKTKTLLATLFVAAIGSTASFAGGLPVMYVVVDRVETTQSTDDKIATIRIWGSFTRRTDLIRRDFAPPVYGFIQFGAGSDPEAPKWRKAAKSGKAVIVGCCGGAGAFETTPIHKAKTKEVGPNVAYPTGHLERYGDFYASGSRDTYPEVKALLTFAKNHVAIDQTAMMEFITESIIDGLKEDGVPRDFAAKLAKNPDYLGKCPLCAPTHQAFVQYSQFDKQPKGKGMPGDLQDRLSSDDTAKRHAALRELVQMYMERGYARKTLGDEEQKAMRQLIAKHRMAGVSSLPSGQKFCPACAGASCTLAR